MKIIQPLLDIDPFEEMGRLNSVICQETISTEGLADSLRNLLPALQKNFSDFVHGFVRSEPAIDLKAREQDFLKLIANKPYLSLTPMVAYVPEGMNASYLEYLKALKAAVEHVSCTQATLNEYSMYLANIITNTNARQFVTASDRKELISTEKEREDVKAAMAKCFKVGSSSAETNYGEVVARNADWKEVFLTLSQATQTMNKISREALHKKADEINHQLETIIHAIRQDRFENAGSDMVNHLSAGAYKCAAELELFTIVFFRLTALNNAISDTVNKVSENLKEQQQ